MDEKLIVRLNCPKTGQKLTFNKNEQRLESESGEYAYPLHNGIPLLLPEAAIALVGVNVKNRAEADD